MSKLFLRSDLEKLFLKWAADFLFDFTLKNKTDAEDLKQIARIAKILQEMENE